MARREQLERKSLMDSELDRTYDKYANQSNEEFENWLDEMYAKLDEEQQELMMGRVEMEVERIKEEIGDF
jgi:hypothetical protein